MFQIEGKAVVGGCHIRDIIDLIGHADVKDPLDKTSSMCQRHCVQSLSLIYNHGRRYRGSVLLTYIQSCVGFSPGPVVPMVVLDGCRR